MSNMVIIIIIAVAVIALAWPNRGLMWRWRRASRRQQRILIEDALKHVHTRHHRGYRATPESLAGALGISLREAVNLIAGMEDQGLLHSTGEGLRLTPPGHGWALQVVRAHRLWERYLADEVGLPLSDIHAAAEEQEHHLTPTELDTLEADLGYPRRDPHGDPIPTAGGELEPYPGKPLVDWPVGEPAQIVHVEDEPETILTQIVAEGLLPGMVVEVLESGEHGLHLNMDGDECWLAPVVAGNIFVDTPPPQSMLPADAERLSTLQPGEKATVLALESKGLTRRRFLDLGLTPGVTIECALPGMFREPKAYRIRGTLVALRREQADQIWVQQTPKFSDTFRV
ncbi:MAG: FeoA domain-containing protein [Anaerolineae bacterium]